MGSLPPQTRERSWWKSSTVYQIYPASFADANGDGTGDLRGIISRLDHIRDLGANIVWLSPMYDSPQVDMGYDISNYEGIYGPYGTLDDMTELIDQCHAKGMRIMLDLVINHTSDQHAWFQESRSSKNNPKRNWYIWRPAKYSPTGERLPPNNWRATFGGGSAWEWDENTQEYYLHLFAKEQPDLNWECPEAKQAIFQSAISFWLERGVDGFRIDTVNLYSKPEDLADAPITDPGSKTQPAHNLYCNGPMIHEYVTEVGAALKKHGAISVGELPNTPDRNRVLKYVSASSRQLDMVFQFDVVDVGFGAPNKYDTVPGSWTLPQFKRAVERTQDIIHGTDGWTTAFIENHDQARSISRFCSDAPEYRVASGKLLALMLSTLSGTLFLYQGQEIGSVNVPLDWTIDDCKDIESLLYYDMVKERSGTDPKELERAMSALRYLSRDNARLPMAWDGSKPNAGFGDGKPWMKVHPLASEINVAAQKGDPKSVLTFWKLMLRLRKEHADLFVYGDFHLTQVDDPHIFMYIKEDAGRKALVVLNFSKETRNWEAPDGQSPGKLLLSTAGEIANNVNTGALIPFEGRVYLSG